MALPACHLTIPQPAGISLVWPWATVTTRRDSPYRARSGHGPSQRPGWYACRPLGSAYHFRVRVSAFRLWPWFTAVTWGIRPWALRRLPCSVLPLPRSSSAF